MTDQQIAILKMCVSGLDFYSLYPSEQETLLWLSREKGFCRPVGETLMSSLYFLTPAGAEFLDALQRDNEKMADDKTEKKTDRAFDLASAAIGALVTVIVQKCFGII